MSPESTALAQAILFGDKSALSAEMMASFRTAGMSHIMAVSGLHVGIIMAMVWWLLRPVEWVVVLVAPVRMSTYYALGDVKRLLTIAITAFYVWRIGAPPSAVRAALMLSLCLLGWMLHRSTSPWRCMVLAALCLLAWDPWMVATPGFQLSFLAVAGILLFRPWLEREDWPRWIRLLLLSVAAQWLSTPIVAYWFHQVPVLGWLQGLLVVPLLPFFVGLLLAQYLFPSWDWLSTAIDLFTAWMGSVAQGISSLERFVLGGHLYFYPAWWEVVLAEAMLLAVVVLIRWRRGDDDR